MTTAKRPSRRRPPAGDAVDDLQNFLLMDLEGKAKHLFGKFRKLEIDMTVLSDKLAGLTASVGALNTRVAEVEAAIAAGGTVPQSDLDSVDAAITAVDSATTRLGVAIAPPPAA